MLLVVNSALQKCLAPQICLDAKMMPQSTWNFLTGITFRVVSSGTSLNNGSMLALVSIARFGAGVREFSLLRTARHTSLQSRHEDKHLIAACCMLMFLNSD